jgi:protein-S-isoprenylcysteine O-methyltransferase Ste14
MRLLRRTPIRTFILYPIITFAWELSINRGDLNFNPLFLPLMLWGFLQYRLCGLYRMKRGGGGPGLESPPERLVSTGPYAYTRNPMYLGHVIYLTGLTLTLQSWFGAALTVAVAIWFHIRVLADEKKLTDRLGRPYMEYTRSVKRWMPGLF